LLLCLSLLCHVLLWQPHTVLEMAYTEQQLKAGITGAALRPIIYVPASPGAAQQAPGVPPASEARCDATGANKSAETDEKAARGVGSAAGMEGQADARNGAGTDGVGVNGAAMDAATVAALVHGAKSDWRQLLPALIASCWEEDPLARPSMAELVKSLCHIASFVAAEDSAAAKKANPQAGASNGVLSSAHINGAAGGAIRGRSAKTFFVVGEPQSRHRNRCRSRSPRSSGRAQTHGR